MGLVDFLGGRCRVAVQVRLRVVDTDVRLVRLQGDGGGGRHGVVVVAEGCQVRKEGRRVGQEQTATAGARVAVRQRAGPHGERRERGFSVVGRRARVVESAGECVGRRGERRRRAVQERGVGGVVGEHLLYGLQKVPLTVLQGQL